MIKHIICKMKKIKIYKINKKDSKFSEHRTQD